MKLDFLYSVIAFIIIFTVVVVVHEFGHFIFAKMHGIKVLEFAIGMGPRIFKFTKGDTTYALRLLPIGGACMFEGEDALEEEDENTKKLKEENPLETQTAVTKGSFRNAPVWVRIMVVLAGPIFNIILGFFLAMFVMAFWPTITPQIGGLVEDMPAQVAGLQEDDIITKVNGSHVYLFKEISLHTMAEGNREWTVEYERDGERFTTTLTPQMSEGGYAIGIYAKDYYQPKGFGILKYSAYEVRFWLKTTIKSLEMLVQGKLTKDDMKGPVGVAKIIGDTIEETKDEGFFTVFSNMVNIALLLSINLGVMNLLPVPALDGGRFVLLLVEAVIRRPLPQKLEVAIQMTGIVLLFALMAFVLFNDVLNLFVK